jgi:hypothetical protein
LGKFIYFALKLSKISLMKENLASRTLIYFPKYSKILKKKLERKEIGWMDDEWSQMAILAKLKKNNRFCGRRISTKKIVS